MAELPGQSPVQGERLFPRADHPDVNALGQGADRDSQSFAAVQGNHLALDVLARRLAAKNIKMGFEKLVDDQTKKTTPQAKVWKAAGIVVKQDGKTVVATGSIPGKLLAEEYAKQK